ncbi:MAG: prepilin-type N-terminal cleavage/methylation domain-containing protein [Phycisphaerae bacterium]
MTTEYVRTQPRRGGFTLIEVAIATAMIGVAIVALLTALAAGTRTNSAGQDLSQAVFLSQAVREWTLSMPYDDLESMDGVTYDTPRNSMGQELTDMIGWSQVVSVSYHEPEDLTTESDSGPTDIARVEVTIRHHDKDVLTTGWLVTR